MERHPAPERLMQVALLLLVLAVIGPMCTGLSHNEDAAWEHAISQDTIESHRRYLEQFPSGEYTDEALQAILDIYHQQIAKRQTLVDYAEDLYGNARDHLSSENEKQISLSREYFLRAMGKLHGPPVSLFGGDGPAKTGEDPYVEPAKAPPEHKDMVHMLSRQESCSSGLMKAARQGQQGKRR